MLRTPRLTLEVLHLERIELLLAAPHDWPSEDVEHLARWRELAVDDDSRSEWRPWTIADTDETIVGHAGFHGPPQPIADALADPSFEGTMAPSSGGVVEIGYTIFEPFRRKGFAIEAVSALLSWARDTGDVSTVIASVRADNVGSFEVLRRLGGFTQIGTCRDDGAEEIVLRRDL